MPKLKQKNNQTLSFVASVEKKAGFSLVECIIALLILTVASLAVISVFNYAFKSNQSAKKRFAALLLAEYRFDELRNLSFINLNAGTVTEENVISDGEPFKVVRTITDIDIITDSNYPGPEEKKITVTVSPKNAALLGETVTLTTFRTNNRPGPNRKENNL